MALAGRHMAFTNKLDAVAKAEQLLLAAGLDVDAIADIVAVLADDATSLEKVNIYMAGDLAVAKLKTLLKGQGAPPYSGRCHWQHSDSRVYRVAGHCRSNVIDQYLEGLCAGLAVITRLVFT